LSSIDEHGFLSEDIENLKKKYHEKYWPSFDLAYKFSSFAQKLLFEINAHDNKPQELLLALFYIRAVSNYQIIIILLEKGALFEARIIFRSLVEIMFGFVACAKDINLAKMYILNDLKDSLKSINKLKQSEKLMAKLSGYGDIDRREEDLKVQIEKEKVKHLSTEDLSRKADLHDHYTTVYHTLSQTAHVKIRDLEQHVDLSTVKFRWGPREHDLNFILLTATGEFIVIVKTLIDFYSISKMSQADKFEELCANLMKKLK